MISHCRNIRFRSLRNNLIKPFQLYLLVLSLHLAFSWLGKIKKDSTTATPRQQKFEIMCLSIKYYRDLLSD